MKLRLAILFLLASMCVACDTSRLTFNDVTELKASEAYDRWIPLGVIVPGAKDIEVSRRSDLVRIKYEYGGQRPLSIDGMRPLRTEDVAKAASYYPKIQGLSHKMSIQFRCNRHTVAPADDPKEFMIFFDVEFVGDTGRDVYYWNSQLEKAFSEFCT